MEHSQIIITFHSRLGTKRVEKHETGAGYGERALLRCEAVSSRFRGSEARVTMPADEFSLVDSQFSFCQEGVGNGVGGNGFPVAWRAKQPTRNTSASPAMETSEGLPPPLSFPP